MIEIINGKAYEKLPENHLVEEVARRTDEIARFEVMLVTLKEELAAMTVKKDELTVQMEALEII